MAFWISAVAVVALITTAARDAAAFTGGDLAGGTKIRTTDPRIRDVVEEGLRRSPTFRALVDRINHSDVVVYLEVDDQPTSGLEGQLTYVATHVGLRYVRVRVALRHTRCRQIAILGHELQHVTEVADAPDVVDAESLGKAFKRIGYRNRPTTASRHQMFDTKAAIRIGDEVLHEVRRRDTSSAD